MLVVCLATLVRATLGFGDALLAMPLLGLLVGIPVATPLMGLVAPTISFSILLGDWRQVEWRATRHLVFATLAGIPFGLLALHYLPEALVKSGLGLLLVLFALYRLLGASLAAARQPLAKPQRPAPVQFPPLVTSIFGFVAGILGAAYNTNSPPVVVYGALQGWTAERFRATLQGYFFPTGLVILAAQGLAGLWSGKVFLLYLFCLPGVLLAIWLGGKLNRRLAHHDFDRLVYFALVILGALLLWW